MTTPLIMAPVQRIYNILIQLDDQDQCDTCLEAPIGGARCDQCGGIICSFCRTAGSYHEITGLCASCQAATEREYSEW